MSETSSSRPSLWFAVLAVAVAAAVWATVAMAAGSTGLSNSGSNASSSPPATFGGQPMYAASGGTHSQGDCPNMGGGSGNGGSTTPSTPSTPSTQNGSSNPGL